MIQAIDRACRILELVAAHNRDIGVVALAGKASLAPSTAHRLLLALMKHGYIKQDVQTEKYTIGQKVVDLARKSLDQHDLRAFARPYLRLLRNRTGQTAHLMVLDEHSTLCIESVESSEHLKISSPVGSRASLYCSAVGKVLLAYLPEEIQRGILPARLKKFTRHTIVSRAAFKEHLAGIRRQGVAFDNEERQAGIRCVAAPVFDRTGTIVAAVGISGPAVSLPENRMLKFAKTVKSIAAAMSQQYPEL